MLAYFRNGVAVVAGNYQFRLHLDIIGYRLRVRLACAVKNRQCYAVGSGIRIGMHGILFRAGIAIPELPLPARNIAAR